jgi:colanic acid biosynthesis glycosyl transferase WcaI
MTERLLLLSPFFYPEPISTGRYNSFLAKALVKKGVPVDVICFHPLYPDWRVHRSDEVLSGVGTTRGGAWVRYPQDNLIRRGVLEVGYWLHIFRNIARLKGYSHIAAVLPPMLFLPLVRLTAGPDARITAIVHDLQGVMAGVGSGAGRMVVCVVRILEAMVLRCSHRVIALSNGMAFFLADAYKIPSSKIAVHWPYVTIDTHNPKGRISHLFAEDKKHIVYAGALGEKQNPDGLISFFIDLVDRRNDLVCHVFSGGPIFETLRLDRDIGSDRLLFHSLIAEQDLYELYLRSHIQVIPEKVGFSEGAIPSKLPNLMASGVPILYIGQRDSDVWKIVQETHAGLCAHGWDFENLNGLVDRLLRDGLNRSHLERRLAFQQKFASLFSVDALIREILR